MSDEHFGSEENPRTSIRPPHQPGSEPGHQLGRPPSTAPLPRPDQQQWPPQQNPGMASGQGYPPPQPNQPPPFPPPGQGQPQAYPG
ncbi:MAG: hypothetical protein L0H93_20390, partial [Nocardioides sp.]|nr:hypothetical protein [Nocardioides sp.]